jgi:hypothetical protein
MFATVKPGFLNAASAMLERQPLVLSSPFLRSRRHDNNELPQADIRPPTACVESPRIAPRRRVFWSSVSAYWATRRTKLKTRAVASSVACVQTRARLPLSRGPADRTSNRPEARVRPVHWPGGAEAPNLADCCQADVDYDNTASFCTKSLSSQRLPEPGASP